MNNTKKSFGTPPKNRGPRANGKMLQQESRYCFALSAHSSEKTELSKQLKAIGKELDVYADTVSKKIDVYPNLYALHGCLVSIKAAVDLRADYTEAMAKLIEGKKSLVELLKSGVDSLGDNPFRNKALKRFIANKRQVEATYITAQMNLKTARQAKEQKDLVAVWEASCTVLESIVTGLSQLESFATVSPSLARKINRIVKPKQLSDFFDQPKHAQKESLKMNTRLCVIIENVAEAVRDAEAMNTVKRKQVDNVKYVTASENAVKPIVKFDYTAKRDSDDDSDDGSAGAVCVR